MGSNRASRGPLLRRAAARNVAMLLAAWAFGLVLASEGRSSDETPIEPGPDVTYPVLIGRSEPEYPDRLRRLAVRGRVTLRIVVRADGTVGDIQVLSSNDQEFSDSAIAAVRQWRYRPAQRAGQPVAVWYQVIAKFTLGSRAYRPSNQPPITPAECYGEGLDAPSDHFDEPPRVVTEVPVTIPRRLGRIRGRVVLEFEVCLDGRVRFFRVLAASDAKLWDAAAAAADGWRFEPAKLAGEPVSALHRAELTVKPSRKQRSGDAPGPRADSLAFGKSTRLPFR